MDYLSPQTRQTRYRKKDGGYYPVIEDSDEDTKEQQSQNNNASPLKNVLLCRPRYATHLRTNEEVAFAAALVEEEFLPKLKRFLDSSSTTGVTSACFARSFFAERLADALALCVFDFFAIQLPALEITTLYTPNKQLHGAAH